MALSNDTAWEILFDRHNIPAQIAQNGRFVISAADINKVREARLMAKFDQSSQLPQIFKQHGLTILPLSRREYVIGPFRTYKTLEYAGTRPKRMYAPKLETIDRNSEAAAMLYAFNSGIFQDLMQSSQVSYTVGGRTTTDEFGFKIQDIRDHQTYHTLDISKAQVEIDGGFETADAFYLCEAKNIMVEEMLVRQLYYPYRLWTGKIRKPVVPVFLIYSNDLYHGFVYRFRDPMNYNSLEFVRYQSYTFSDTYIGMEDLHKLSRRVVVGQEPEVTFPQANSFVRVVDLLTMLLSSALSKDEITYRFAFDERQTDYYLKACEYLGLLVWRADGEKIRYKLTAEAVSIMGLSYREKYLALAEKVLQRPVFHGVFCLALERGAVPEVREICSIMQQCGLPLNPSTIKRRASTVRGWVSWLMGLCDTDQLRWDI